MFTTWPLLAFYTNNLNETVSFYTARIVLLWAVFAVVIVLPVLFLSIILGREEVDRAAFTIGYLVTLFFHYYLFSDLLLDLGVQLNVFRLGVWLVAMMAIGWVLWKLSRHALFRQLSLTAVAIFVIVPVVKLIAFEFGSPGANDARAHVGTESQETARPNVYWILLDMYGRADALKDSLGYDNSYFIQSLEERDFQVASDSYSNHTGTKFSIVTTLAMKHFLSVGKVPEPHSYLSKLRGYNRTIFQFKEIGYRYLHAESGGGVKTPCAGVEDRCIRGQMGGTLSFTEAEVAVLKMTPLYRVLRWLNREFIEYTLTDVDDISAALRIEADTPFFLFAHILSPHAPARYDAQCERREDLKWDLSAVSGERGKANYLQDITCLNRDVLALLDTIVAQDSSNPIIIVSADHGFDFRGHAGPPREWRELRDVYAILMSIRAPGRPCMDAFYPSISPVNQFRLVFACLSDSEPQFVADTQFSLRHGRLQVLETNGQL